MLIFLLVVASMFWLMTAACLGIKIQRRRRLAVAPPVLSDEEYVEGQTLRPPVDYRRLAITGRRRSS